MGGAEVAPGTSCKHASMEYTIATIRSTATIYDGKERDTNREGETPLLRFKMKAVVIVKNSIITGAGQEFKVGTTINAHLV